MGLDLPNDDAVPFIDDDSDSSNDFDIDIVNAGHRKGQRKDSDNSYEKPNSNRNRAEGVIEISDDVGINDLLNSSGTKRTISTAIGKLNS